MRPLKIEMQAFGPYLERQTIDFSLLKNRLMFLITGPTGAGKTTILDAMSFAVFGESSGGEREAKQMRTLNTPDKIKTEVVFEFMLGEKKYRIERSFSQDKKNYKAVLFVEEDGRFKALETKPTGVNERAEKIIGCSEAQFRQVIMLPQGRFRELLTARSDEREKILEKLFETSLYKIITDRLKKEAKNLNDAISELEIKKETLLENAGVDDVEDVSATAAQMLSEMKELERQFSKLSKIETDIRAEHLKAIDENKKLRELEESRSSLKNLESKRNENETLENRLARAMKATGLVDAEKNAESRMREQTLSEKMLLEVQATLTASKEALDKSKKAFEIEKSKQKNDERNNAQNNLTRLRDLEPRVLEIEIARKAVEKAQIDFNRCDKELKEIEKSLTDKNDELKKVNVEIEKNRTTSSTTETLKTKVESLKTAFSARKRVDELAKDAALLEAKHNKAAEATGKAGKEHKKAVENYNTIEHAWKKAQAAVLAQGLKKGYPCPVCGSEEHPVPAKYDGELTGETELENAKQEVQDKLRLLDEAKEKQNDLISDLKAKQETRGALLESLGDKSALSANELDNDIRTINGSLKDAQISSVAHENSLKLKKNLEKDIQGLEEKKKVSALRREELSDGLSGCKTRLELATKEVPKELQDGIVLKRAIIDAEKKLKSFKEALEKAEFDFNTASSRYASDVSSYNAGKKSKDDAIKFARDSSGEFLKKMTTAGFTDVSDYKEAKLSENEIRKLDDEIKRYAADTAAAKDRFKRADKVAKGMKLSDMAAIEKKLNKTTSDREIANKACIQAGTEQKRLVGLLSQLNDTTCKISDLEGKYTIAGHLADIASGENSMKVTFQRWVLSAMLDQVLLAASSRFRLMSRNRYELRRGTEVADRRTGSGLDLMVYDAYSDDVRPVQTLSGGEGFIAALSLALGLSDVVQEYAGGIKLDTIFIDEGFGSLDPESLDLAMQTLIDMQSSGRLVGPISHVPELKERIDARLEIISGREGSSAAFVV